MTQVDLYAVGRQFLFDHVSQLLVHPGEEDGPGLNHFYRYVPVVEGFAHL